jgi:NAD(P)-dependent dehydrogenase (short-subunit alcohol dehydrogenase family)
MTARKSAVVTGASTGIGWGTTKVLIEKGFHVFGTVRRQTDAERLQAEFGEAFMPLLMDVTDETAIRMSAEVVSKWLGSATLDGLVNNAGIVIGGPLLHLAPSEYRRQMEVNLIGPLLVTQAFAPLLGVNRARTGKPGRIVNISSVVGKFGIPFIGAYVASKHGLEGFSESLRRELMLYGIDVIVIGPGSVVTPIWDKAEAEDFSIFDKTDYGPIIRKFTRFMIEDGRKGLTPEALGETVYTALTTPQPKTRYAVVPQRLKNWTIPQLLPKRLVDRFIGKQFGLVPDRG